MDCLPHSQTRSRPSLKWNENRTKLHSLGWHHADCAQQEALLVGNQVYLSSKLLNFFSATVLLNCIRLSWCSYPGDLMAIKVQGCFLWVYMACSGGLITRLSPPSAPVRCHFTPETRSGIRAMADHCKTQAVSTRICISWQLCQSADRGEAMTLSIRVFWRFINHRPCHDQNSSHWWNKKVKVWCGQK